MEACKEYSLESSFYSAVALTWQVSSRVGSPQCDNSIGASHAAKKVSLANLGLSWLFMIGSKIWKPTRLLLNKFAASPEMEKARWKFCVGRTYESSASRRASGHYGGQVLRLGVLILMWSVSRESDCFAVRLFAWPAKFGGFRWIMSPTTLSQNLEHADKQRFSSRPARPCRAHPSPIYEAT